MVSKVEGDKWLMELTGSVKDQLKEDRNDIVALWEAVNRGKEMHMTCREQIFEKLADLDKRLEITIIKVGTAIGTILVLAEYLFNHLLGK